MEPADHRLRTDQSQRGRLDLSRHRAVLLQPEVRSRSMVVDAVSVPQYVLRRLVQGKRLDDLLSCPLRGGRLGHVEMNDLPGAALAGPADFIAEARIWQRRHGGNLVHLYPYVLSARLGLRERLDRMEAYRDKAVEIAATLTSVPGIRVTPDPPQTNMMHVYLSGSRERLEKAALEIAKETGQENLKDEVR